MNTKHVNSLSIPLVLLIGSVWFGAPRTAMAGRPVVVVEVVTSNLPDEFQPDGGDVPARLKQRLEDEAVARLNDPFPLFTWVAEHDPNRPSASSGTLTIELAKEAGITWRIYLSCSYKLRGGAVTPLSIVEPTLYADGEDYPYPAAVERDAFQRGRKALATLTEVGSLDKWRQQFIRQVPLADDLLPAANNQSLLIIPLLASELQARHDTLLEAELVTKIPGKDQQNSFFELNPGGPVYGPAQTGLQECTVKVFRYGGLMFDKWVNDIGDVIANRLKGKIVVRASNYIKRDSSGISLNP